LIGAASRGDPEAVRDPLDRYVDAVKALAGRRRASSRPSRHVSIAAKFSSTSIARYRSCAATSARPFSRSHFPIADCPSCRPRDLCWRSSSPPPGRWRGRTHREPIIPGCALVSTKPLPCSATDCNVVGCGGHPIPACSAASATFAPAGGCGDPFGISGGDPYSGVGGPPIRPGPLKYSGTLKTKSRQLPQRDPFQQIHFCGMGDGF
jgi:hypothetical protein